MNDQQAVEDSASDHTGGEKEKEDLPLPVRRGKPYEDCCGKGK